MELSSALDVMERVRRHSDAVALAFVRLFLDEVWKPFERDGQPEERWSEVTEAIQSLRPLASEAVLAAFQLSLASEMEDASARRSSARPSGRSARQGSTLPRRSRRRAG